MMRSFVTILAMLCAMRAAADEAAVRIVSVESDPTRVAVVYQLPPAAAAELKPGPVAEAVGQRYLSLALIDEKSDTAGPPIFGSYVVAEGRLTLRPTFGLVRGATYLATAPGPTSAASPLVVEYRVPAAATAEPTVVHSIAPTGDALPANVLRFYITFSRPMREGSEVLQRIKLFDDAGREIAAPWRDQELWNADATRLSLFVHPGRIKQGVNLREQLGPVLQPNRKYVLVIGDDLRDAQGAPLGREVRREFTTTAEVRSRIDVTAWRVSAPRVGTREPLRVEFDRPLDAALMLRFVRVRDAAGSEVAGAAESADRERSWIFTPTDAWRAESYAVQADPALEDQAGNSPVRVFDRDLDQAGSELPSAPRSLTFTPR